MESKIRRELDKILNAQKQKGITRWMIACSLIVADYSECQVGKVMNCDPRTVHSMKTRPVRRVIKDYLVMDAVTRSRFFKMVRQILEETL